MFQIWRREAIVVVTMASATLLALAGPAAAQVAGPDVAGPNAGGVPVISTVAGKGTAGFNGDGGPATAAKLNQPSGLAEDIAGNLYIGDTLNNRVRKVTPGGVITTVAGNGQPGFAGDGGPAIAAKLLAPSGVAVDGSGNLYIGDTDNNRVRKVSPTGIISTYAGTGVCGLSGDGGLAARARLCRPQGVAADGSDLLIADTDNNVIRKVTSAGTITTIAGHGPFGWAGDGGPAVNARLGLPTGVAVDALHEVFIADTSNNKVREVTPAGTIRTFAGTGAPGFGGDNGPATAALLTHPTGVTVDSVGDVYIADTFNARIRVVIPKGDILTYAGKGIPGFSGDGGPATRAKVNTPTLGLATDGANLFFADTGNQRIRKVQGGPPPNIPESPLTVVLLPLSAVAVLCGAVAFGRRRDRLTASSV